MARFKKDGWTNVLTGLGRALRDKRVRTEFSELPSLTFAQLDMLYQGDWIIARACDRPAAEMTRKWIEIKAKDASEQAQDCMAAMSKLGAKPAFKLANTWARLYGGGMIIMGIDDGQRMSDPVDEKRIRKVEWLRVVDRWDLNPSAYYGSDEKPGSVGEPSRYRLNTSVNDPDGKANLGEEIHETRILRFDGMDTPLRLRVQNEMWCYGVVHRIYPVVRDFWNAYGGAAHLTTDFAQGVYKIKGLAKMLAEDKDQLIIQRISLLDMARSVARLVPVDADEEDLERKPTPVSGLGELMDRFGETLAGAIDMPISVLLGKATPGIGDTGNSQLQQWYDRIANDQETRIVPQATMLGRYLFLAKEGPTRGAEPESWSVDPLPLWEMTDKEIAELRKSQAESDRIMIEADVLSPIEVRRSRYGGEEYSLNTTLEDGVEEMLERTIDPTQPDPDDPTMFEQGPAAEPVDPDRPEGEKPQDTAMNGGQVKALSDVLIAYNSGDLSREQAIGIVAVSFNMLTDEAARLVGEREDKPKPPAPPPGQFPPPPPGQPPKPPPPPGQPPQPDEPGEPEEPPRGDAFNEDRIVHEGGKWIVYSEGGRKLGEHDTEAEAKKHLAAIEAAKHSRG